MGEMDDASEDLVFRDDDLTWGQVATIFGVIELERISRHQSRLRGSSSLARPEPGALGEVQCHEDDIIEEEYHSGQENEEDADYDVNEDSVDE